MLLVSTCFQALAFEKLNECIYIYVYTKFYTYSATDTDTNPNVHENHGPCEFVLEDHRLHVPSKRKQIAADLPAGLLAGLLAGGCCQLLARKVLSVQDGSLAAKKFFSLPVIGPQTKRFPSSGWIYNQN